MSNKAGGFSKNWLIQNIANSQNKLLLIAAVILISGLLLDLFIPKHEIFDNWFPRSGSICVCYALLCVYLNHIVSGNIDNAKSVLSAINKGGVSENAKVSFGKGDPNELGLTPEIMKSYTKGEYENKHSEFSNTKSNLLKAEVIVGIIGTFVWGFGDIITVLLSCFI